MVFKSLKEKIKMNAELRKRKQVLLEKQLNQQKLLIERMEAGNIKTEQKTTIMATIKSLQVLNLFTVLI